jgi:uncharacterized integral membrane protein (TIGR00697 family)
MFKIEKMDLLVSLYIFCILVAELMGAKTVHWFNVGSFSLNVTVAIFVLPLIFTINDVVIEVHGKERARSIVRSGLVTVFGVLLFALFATALPPSARFASTEAAYDTIFKTSARIAAASLTALAISEFVDLFVFSKIRARLGKKALWLRNNVSNWVAQFFDTTLFMTLAFYNVARPFDDNWTFLLGLIIPYWLVKCSISVIETPLVYAGVKWLKGEAKK